MFRYDKRVVMSTCEGSICNPLACLSLFCDSSIFQEVAFKVINCDPPQVKEVDTVNMFEEKKITHKALHDDVWPDYLCLKSHTVRCLQLKIC